MQTGLVLRSTGSWYDVVTDGEVCACRIPGKFRLSESGETNPLAVGDRVTYEKGDDGSGMIKEILPRDNQISRKAAGRKAGLEHVIVANVDRAWIVQAPAKPKLNPGFIDRVLVMTEAFHLDTRIILNKVDLLDDGNRKSVEKALSVYENLGYQVFRTSAIEGTGMDELKAELSNGIHVVVGPSGSGKSSLLNAINPDFDIATLAVSEKTQKGKHTTTVASLLEISPGCYLADTPGMREFGIWDIEPAELDGYMVDLRQFVHDCHFPDCSHVHEPKCAVKAAVDAGQIEAARYKSYVNMLSSLEE